MRLEPFSLKITDILALFCIFSVFLEKCRATAALQTKNQQPASVKICEGLFLLTLARNDSTFFSS